MLPRLAMLGSDLSSTPDQVVESEKPLSKNARKRLAKAARRAEQKLERRAKEKALKKEKKRARAIEAEDDPLPRPKKQRIAPQPFEARIVIDLGFDELMTPKVSPQILALRYCWVDSNLLLLQERASLCSQLGYTYSSQRRSSTPFSSLVFSSLGGQTKAHLETVGQGAYTRWKHVQWWEEDYEKIWSLSSGPDSDDKSAKSKVVYLTADSDNEISELEVGCAYVIGGIVDHNRYKNLCLDKANKQGIKTAKLPIGTYLAGQSQILDAPKSFN